MAKNLSVESNDPKKTKTVSGKHPITVVEEQVVTLQNERLAVPHTTCQTTLKDTLASLIPDALRPHDVLNQDQLNRPQESNPSAIYHSNLKITTPREISANAGRGDVVAGVDEIGTITRKLESLLSVVTVADAVINSDYENAPEACKNTSRKPFLPEDAETIQSDRPIIQQSRDHKHGTRKSSLDDDTSDTRSQQGSTQHAANFPKSVIQPSLHSHDENKTPNDRQQSQWDTSHQYIPQTQATESTEPSLFRQTADTIGSAWYPKDETYELPTPPSSKEHGDSTSRPDHRPGSSLHDDGCVQDF